MAIKCRYKITGHLPFAVENRLVTKYGFRIHSRSVGQWVIIERDVRTQRNPKQLPAVQNVQADPEPPLPWDTQHRLIKRCNEIVDFFVDPYNSKRAIKQRLHNMSQRLSPPEQEFVVQWTEDNIEKVF